MNKVELSGRIVNDVKLEKSKGGDNVYIKNTIAVAKKGKKDETNFIDFVIFGKLAEAMNKYSQKGDRIIICGSIDISNYKDKEGNVKKTISVIVDDFYFVDFHKIEEK